jgi:hypothetical protein
MFVVAAAGCAGCVVACCRYGQTPSWFVLFRSQKAAAIAASCNILPMNQDLFQVGAGSGRGQGHAT